MKKPEKIIILDTLRKIINENITQNNYQSLTQLAMKLQKKHPDLLPNRPNNSMMSKYMKAIGYRADKAQKQYVPLDFVNVNSSRLQCFDQPITTVIKTATEDLENIRDCIMAEFGDDIIHIHSEKTDAYGVLIIYTTRYNLSSAFHEKLERDAAEYYAENENME